VKKIQNKQVARFGSYGWSGGAQRRFEQLIEPLKWELTGSFEFVGSPSEEDLKHGEAFGAQFARAIKGD
jgi:anaerobic nitric oxide reductase flavorubredoxin